MAAPVPGQVRKGETDNTPIVLKEVSVEHFAKFLWVFYNPWVLLLFKFLSDFDRDKSLCRVYSVYTATLPEWKGILKLANEYEFPEVKRLAIRELEEFDIPIAERMVLYQTHAVDPVYLVPLYVKLCMRDEGPSDEETEIMGMKTSLIIFRARERLRFRPLPGKNTSLAHDENDVTRTIHSLLGFDYNGQNGLVTFTYRACDTVTEC